MGSDSIDWILFVEGQITLGSGPQDQPDPFSEGRYRFKQTGGYSVVMN